MDRFEVTVVGSANADLALTVARIPRAGETVLAGGRRAGPGGKGLNQAVAAARAGAATAFVGSVGRDPDGDLVRELLRAEGVTPILTASSAPTGLALVVVDAKGENSIVVAPGANATVGALTQPAADVVRRSSVVVLQLEIPLSLVADAAGTARRAGARVVLNAAPAAELPGDLLADVDVLVVNEGEARTLAAGAAADADLDAVLDDLLGAVPAVAVTLGAAGAGHALRAGRRGRVRPPVVDAVDTTAAGDTFTGYLAAALAAGVRFDSAAQWACVAGALCVARPGAATSVPHRAEVEAALTGQRRSSS